MKDNEKLDIYYKGKLVLSDYEKARKKSEKNPYEDLAIAELEGHTVGKDEEKTDSVTIIKKLGKDDAISVSYTHLADFMKCSGPILGASLVWGIGLSLIHIYLKGVDIPVFLESSPEETKARRIKRGRDENAASPFICRVVELEQEKLDLQGKNARIVVGKDGKVYEQ